MSIVSICDNCDILEAQLDSLGSDIANAKRQATEAQPDYPWALEPPNPASEIAWALCTGLEGSRKANKDLHAEIKRLTTILRDMCIGHEEGCACVGCHEVFRQE